jgi:hypothetical protein
MVPDGPEDGLSPGGLPPGGLPTDRLSPDRLADRPLLDVRDLSVSFATADGAV